MATIDAKDVYYRLLNKRIRDLVEQGETDFELINVNGQRYIGGGITKGVNITINGVPGNDLASFMDGPNIVVMNNAQDAIGNTMNSGKVVVHGNAGDVLGYGMRGGKIFIRGEVGYRVGIHMKSYKDQIPVIIAGEFARDFFGEYMAGGILILLGLNRKKDQPIVGDYCGTGMHGGVMYIRGEVDPYQCGAEVGMAELNADDKTTLERLLAEYCKDLNIDYDMVMKEPFVKLYPKTLRPYGRLYAY